MNTIATDQTRRRVDMLELKFRVLLGLQVVMVAGWLLSPLVKAHVNWPVSALSYEVSIGKMQYAHLYGDSDGSVRALLNFGRLVVDVPPGSPVRGGGGLILEANGQATFEVASDGKVLITGGCARRGDARGSLELSFDPGPRLILKSKDGKPLWQAP